MISNKAILQVLLHFHRQSFTIDIWHMTRSVLTSQDDSTNGTKIDKANSQ